jgi:3-hydroxyacyl-[acyl-carrier-protein] dehydratase
MRWFWIDRMTEFESGRRATAIKNVSLAEDHIHDHFPGGPYMPNSLVTEGLAQTGGLLVGETTGFEARVVLAKVSRIQFHFFARPGDTLTYRCEILDSHADGSVVSGTSHVGDRLQAEAQIFFAKLSGRHGDRPLFRPGEFLTTLRIFGIYDVGRKSDGSPLEIPKRLLDAEALLNGRASG